MHLRVCLACTAKILLFVHARLNDFFLNLEPGTLYGVALNAHRYNKSRIYEVLYRLRCLQGIGGVTIGA